MAGELQQLKALIRGTDLQRFEENEAQLKFAIDYAVSQINIRRRYTSTDAQTYEPQYTSNVIQGARDYLETVGGSENQSYAENGVSVSRKELPSWLADVIPVVGVVL